MTTLHERLEQVFQTVFNDDELRLTDDTTARDIPAWDSVAHVNLMFALEDHFGVRFAGNELAELENVAALKAHLAARGAGDAA